MVTLLTVTGHMQGTPISTPASKSDGTPMGTPISTLNSKSKCTPTITANSKSECTLKGTPDPDTRLTENDEHAIQSEWHTKMRLAHQDNSVSHSICRMAKFVEVYPEKSVTLRNLNDVGQPNQEEYDGKSKPSQGYEPNRDVTKFSMLDELQENVDDHEYNEVEIAMMNDDVYKPSVGNKDDVKNREEVRDEIFEDVCDVCDFIAEDDVSSYNSPVVKMQDKVKTSLEGEVDEEPGGNVTTRSRSLRFRQSIA